MVESSMGAVIGLYGGMLCGLFGWWFGRKKAKKNRGLDEVYDHIWQKARSYSWYVTLGSIYILFSLIVFGIELSPAMILGVLLLVHLGSWGIIGAVLSGTMFSTGRWQPTHVKLGLIVVAVSIVVFTAVSILTNNWKFLLFSIPPNAIVLVTMFVSKESN